jgi:two-component system phosphate regulon sensor histidine kinase PhoR
MRLSIYWKIFLTDLLVIVVLTALVLFFVLKSIEKHGAEIQRRDLTRLARGLEVLFAGAVLRGEALPDSLVAQVGLKAGTGIVVIGGNGDVIAGSGPVPGSAERIRTRPEIMRAFRGEPGISRRSNEEAGEDLLYVAVPIRSGAEIPAVLRLSRPLREMSISTARLRNSIILFAAVVVVLALVVAMLSSRAISGPLRRLSEASGRVASGDFEARVFLKSRDEIGELAAGFNMMAERLGDLFGRLSTTGDELRGVVSAIRDALVVLDADGRILLANVAFREMTGATELEGKMYWEVLRLTEFADLVRSAADGQDLKVGEITFGGKSYTCSIGRLGSGGGVVIVFHDVTEIKKVEKVKRDFVVNLSHELKTPLTAISGFIETIENEVSAEGARYLDIIRRHAARLTSIIDDLLLLAELEERRERPELEDVNLAEVIENVLRIFEHPAKEKNLNLSLNVTGGSPVIRGDAFKIEQVFINLIANAMRYTEAGGVSIEVRTRNDEVVVKVEDTGIGIPREHQARIFERFYVVDKSRSRSLGGTGLGLAIVKHIVLAHNGSVAVESTPGKGSKFTLRLPRNPL